GAGLLGSILIDIFTGAGAGLFLFIVGYCLLWLIAIIDLFSSWNMTKRYYEDNRNKDPESQYIGNEKMKENNKKITALALSIVPGAGHMFLGYEKKGLIIMGGFFFSIFFMGWLGMSFLLFLLPLLWFYSFFDTMHTVDGNKEQVEDKDFELSNIRPEWVGYGSIAIGILVVVERILYPLIDYRIRHYIQTSIVSLIFIILGIYILNKNKDNKEIVTREEEDNDE